jgi:hypothetical protein
MKNNNAHFIRFDLCVHSNIKLNLLPAFNVEVIAIKFPLEKSMNDLLSYLIMII